MAEESGDSRGSILRWRAELSRARSQPSSVVPIPLLKTKGELEARSKSVAYELAKLLATTSASLQFHPEFASEMAVSELQGTATEMTQGRNWGRSTQVARLCDFGGCGHAWISLRERWNFAVSRGGRSFYAFESAGLTVFAGEEGQIDKAQILRAEWAGFTDRGSGASFQAGSAAHPHWQIDLFETLRGASNDVVRFGDQTAVRPFSASNTALGLKEKLQLAPFERFHFASAAQWWQRNGEGCDHQHTPSNTDEISRWVLGSVGYVREQLAVVARGLARGD